MKTESKRLPKENNKLYVEDGIHRIRSASGINPLSSRIIIKNESVIQVAKDQIKITGESDTAFFSRIVCQYIYDNYIAV